MLSKYIAARTYFVREASRPAGGGRGGVAFITLSKNWFSVKILSNNNTNYSLTPKSNAKTNRDNHVQLLQ